MEVREEGGVRQVLQSGGVVSHDIQPSWEEMASVAVAVFPLVLAGIVAQMGCRAIIRDRPSANAREGRGVVSACGDGGAADVMMGSLDGHLRQGPSMLQVAVGDVPSGIVSRHQAVLDGREERLLPHVALAKVIIIHPTHPCLCGVGGADEGGVLWHDLG